MSKENGIEEQNPEFVEPQQVDQKETQVKDEPVEMQRVRYVPDDVVALYSDSMTVLHTQNEFILSFFLSHYPAAETTKELQEVKIVRSRCIAQILMNPVQMQKVIDALQGNMERFKKSQQQE